jgi:ribosomal protein S18 acetylase RimI-like enzyme
VVAGSGTAAAPYDRAVVIREARAGELAAAGHVTQAAWREFERPGDAAWIGYFDRLGDARGRAERAVVLAAVEGEVVVGTATLELERTLEDAELPAHEARLRMLAVAPEWRGRGVGRKLVEACLERARAAGKTEMRLHTMDVMVPAAALYRSFGFERDTDSDFTPAPGVTALAYRLRLHG